MNIFVNVKAKYRHAMVYVYDVDWYVRWSCTNVSISWSLPSLTCIVRWKESFREGLTFSCRWSNGERRETKQKSATSLSNETLYRIQSVLMNRNEFPVIMNRPWKGRNSFILWSAKTNMYSLETGSTCDYLVSGISFQVRAFFLSGHFSGHIFVPLSACINVSLPGGKI